MEEKNETVKIKKDTLYQITIGVLALLLAISFFTGGFGSGAKANANAVAKIQPSIKNAPSNPAKNINMNSLMDDDAVEGDPNAPVTIVEFSDYECPFCKRFYSQTLGQIRSEYIDTGKVKLVYRDFPLSLHPQAQKAAEAAECAGEQGKYYEMHNQLFENGVDGGVESFKVYASNIGLDRTAFDNCLDTGAMASEVAKDFSDGQTIGIKGTPGFIINGNLISGAQPFSVFKQAIDSLL